MIYFLSLDFSENVRNVFLGIAAVVYNLLEQAAQLFFDVSVVELLDNATVAAIYQRVGLILGLFMLFKLTFSFIQMVVDPDQMTDKNNGIGSIIKKLVVVVFLLGMTPTIFRWGFDLQEALVKDQTIGKIILGDQVKETGDIGKTFSVNLFASFADDATRGEFRDGLLSNDETTKLNYGDIKDYMSDGSITGIGTALFCLIVGGIALWMFLTYTIATATRVVQLMFLELISPIPIISFISSKKENAFQSWIKQVLTTYLDLFIRMFIFYIAILMIQLIMSNDTSNSIYNSVGMGNASSPMFLVYIMLILGVLMFMKKAPQLIEELFPGLKTKASLGFGIGDKEGPGKMLSPLSPRRVGGAAIGAVGAGTVGAVSRIMAKRRENQEANKGDTKVPLRKGLFKAGLTGFGAGARQGVIGGITAKEGVTGGIDKKNFGKVFDNNERYLANERNGYTMRERWDDLWARKLGYQNYAQRLKQRKMEYDQQKAGMDIVRSAYKGVDAEMDSVFNEKKFMSANYGNSEQGRKIQQEGLRLMQLDAERRALADPSSEAFKAVAEAKIQKAKNDKIIADVNVSAAERTKAEQENIKLDAVINREAQVQYEYTDGLKKWKKAAGDYLTSEQAIKDGTQEQRAINIINDKQAELDAHNAANKDSKLSQVTYDLKGSTLTEMDNFIKGKKEYEKISIDSSTGQIIDYNGNNVGYTVDSTTGQTIWNCKFDPKTNKVYKTNPDGSFLKQANGERVVVYYNVDKNGTTIDHDTSVVATEIDRQIKEREMKISGNKSGSGK